MSRIPSENLSPELFGYSFENARVLIVDDEPIVAKVVAQQLRLDGFRDISFETDPYQALATIREFQPDIVLLDISMPGMGGLEVLELIRADKSLDDVEVLILSSSDRKTKYKAMRMGAVDFVNKPVDAEELGLRIRHALRVL